MGITKRDVRLEGRSEGMVAAFRQDHAGTRSHTTAERADYLLLPEEEPLHRVLRRRHPRLRAARSMGSPTKPLGVLRPGGKDIPFYEFYYATRRALIYRRSRPM